MLIGISLGDLFLNYAHVFRQAIRVHTPRNRSGSGSSRTTRDSLIVRKAPAEPPHTTKEEAQGQLIEYFQIVPYCLRQHFRAICGHNGDEIPTGAGGFSTSLLAKLSTHVVKFSPDFGWFVQMPPVGL